ncbi:MAG: DUF3347 domain-containing protein, partial [Hymenobacteraceae bacterium]|nr:DUF3347 domain-containing protein [Hymenobacteraceae bacterium]
MKKTVLTATLIVTGLGLFSACSSEKTKEQADATEITSDSEPQETATASVQTSEAFQNSFKEAAQAYLKLKNELVQSNAAQAQAAAAELAQMLDQVDAASLMGEAQQKWEEQVDPLKTNAKAI